MGRKYGILLVAVMLVLLLCGCSGKHEDIEYEDTASPGGAYWSTFNDNGIFFCKDRVLYMLDPETGVRAPLCSKVNCNHKGKSSSNPHPTCDAYFGQGVGYSAIVGGKLYCLVTVTDDAQGAGGMFVKEFYRSEVDGTERKLLYRADDIQFSTVGRYENGYFLYAYYNTEDVNGEELDSNELGMCILDLRTEEMHRVYLDALYGGVIWSMTERNGKVYYGLSYATESLKDFDYESFSNPENLELYNSLHKVEIWEYDIKTGESGLVFTCGYGIPQLCMSYGYLYYSFDDKEHIVRDLASGKEYRILREEKDLKMINMVPDGILFYDDGNIELWRYGTEECEIIGEIPKNEYIFIEHMSKKWVYANIFYYENDDRMNSTRSEEVYCSREDFMKGNFEWNVYDLQNDNNENQGNQNDASLELDESKTATGIDETDTNNQAGINNDYEDSDGNTIALEHPDEYYVKWAVPSLLTKVDEETVEKINRKLEADGYDFGLKLMFIDDISEKKTNLDELYLSGADIVYTGFYFYDEDGNMINIAEDGLMKGKFACLDGYLDGSLLYASRPKLFWNRVMYHGSIYLFPSEWLQPGGDCVLYNDEYALDGDLCSLSKCIEDGRTLYYGLRGFAFMGYYGYYYDELKGIVVDKDGNIVNPFGDEHCIEWLKTLRDIYKNGLLVTDASGRSKRASCDIQMPDAADNGMGKYGCMWKYPMCRTYNLSTAILESSDNKDNAFRLIEALRIRPDYGNLLIYGIEDSEKESPKNSASSNKVVFGLDDGLLQVDDGNIHFKNCEERQKYYDENVAVSPTLYMDFPPECTELKAIVDKYLGIQDNFITYENFEDELEKFRKEYTEVLEKVRSAM